MCTILSLPPTSAEVMNVLRVEPESEMIVLMMASPWADERASEVVSGIPPVQVFMLYMQLEI
jgi:hypothetical protein